MSVESANSIEPLESRLFLAATPAFQFGVNLGAGVVYNDSLAADAQGNSYVAGNMHGDISIAKYDRSGQRRWRYIFGSTGFDAAMGVAVNTDGSVYVTGLFSKTVNFDPGDGQFLLKSAGDTDGFLMKLDSDGEFIWARRFGGKIADQGLNVAVHNGHVYLTGLQQGLPTRGAFSIGPQIKGVNHFLALVNGNGQLQWARTISKVGGGESAGIADIALDSKGYIWATGAYHGTYDFGTTADPMPLTSGSDMTIFLWKLNGRGATIGAANGGDGDIEVHGLAIDPKGFVYVTGGFRGEAVFNPNNHLPGDTVNNSKDMFLARYNKACVLNFAKGWGTESDDIGESLALDTAGNVWISGYTTAQAQQVMAVEKWTPVTVNRAFSTANQVFAGRTGGWATGWSIATGGGLVYALGTFSGTVDIDPTLGVHTVKGSGVALICLR